MRLRRNVCDKLETSSEARATRWEDAKARFDKSFTWPSTVPSHTCCIHTRGSQVRSLVRYEDGKSHVQSSAWLDGVMPSITVDGKHLLGLASPWTAL